MRILSLFPATFSAISLALLPLSALPDAGRAASYASPVVVELYTSQGCSSCPPADELLTRLSQRDDILALAYHVDYWDYIGWADSFAAPAYTDRQRGYAQVAGRNMVYTPQMVVMGQDDVVGADAMALSDTIRLHEADQPLIDLDILAGASGAVRLRLAPIATGALGDRVLSVQLVRYMKQAEVEITRGELAGTTMTYTNIVRSHQELARWDGAEAIELDFMDADSAQESAVLVQEWPYGRIVAAARITRP